MKSAYYEKQGAARDVIEVGEMSRLQLETNTVLAR